MRYDRESRQVITDRVIEVRETIQLSPMEGAIFELLLARCGSIVSTSDLLDEMDRVNGTTFHVGTFLAVCICHIRNKLHDHVKITTHPKKGYSIMSPLNEAG